MSEVTLVPLYMLSILTGIVTVGWGVAVEKHFVSKKSIILTVFNLIVTWTVAPLFSLSFFVISFFMGIGLYVISDDALRQRRRFWVAFTLGSKTIGVVTLFLGIFINGWIMKFQPLFSQIFNTISQSDPNLQVYVTIFTFFLLLGIVQIVGLIVSSITHNNDE